jgi:hypothetical protein
MSLTYLTPAGQGIQTTVEKTSRVKCVEADGQRGTERASLIAF